MATHLRVEAAQPVARLVWDSDDGLHRLSLAFLQTLREALTHLSTLEHVRAVVLTGTGKRVFSAGADLREVAAIPDAEAAERFSAEGQAVTSALANLPVPTLAVLGGPAYGGGIELALACDFRLAAPHTTLRYQAGEWGLLPGWGGTQRLPHLIGLARARRMMLTGYPVTADEALQWGLIDDVLNGSDVEPGVESWLAALQRQQPQAAAQLKRALSCTESADFATERAAFAACFADGTTQARIHAWLERNYRGDRFAPPSPSVPAGTPSGAEGATPGTSSPAGATHG